MYSTTLLSSFRIRLLNHAQSFLAGVPLASIDNSYTPDDVPVPSPKTPPGNDKKDKGLKVIDYMSSKKKINKKKLKEKDKNKVDNPDFDWI